MNDIFLAANNTLKTTFIGQQVEVRQLRVRDLDALATIAYQVKVALANDLSNIDNVLDEQLMACLRLCSALTGLSLKVLIDGFSTNYDEAKSLVKSAIEINAAYFIATAEEIEQRGEQEQSDATWFDAFQFLISQGHRHDDIMNMSYGAFRAYIKAAQRTQGNDLLLQTNAIRVAQHADKRGFTKFIDGLKV